MLIQKLRLKKGWSQHQLAMASGLSARTIQRLEAGLPASLESLKSIAAVFEVDFETLSPASESVLTQSGGTTQNPNLQENPMNAHTAKPVKEPMPTQDQDPEIEAFRQVRELRKFYLHLIRYAVVVSGLAAVNFVISPQYPWVLWVIGGWGIGLISQAVRVFQPQLFLGPQWERRQVEKRLGRSL